MKKFLFSVKAFGLALAAGAFVAISVAQPSQVLDIPISARLGVVTDSTPTMPGLNLEGPSEGALREICDSSQSIKQRIAALHSITTIDSLTMTTLCRFVTALPAEGEPNIGSMRYLKNEVLNVLGHDDSARVQLARVLISVARNDSQDVVLRDYAVQHLVACARAAQNNKAILHTTIAPVLRGFVTARTSLAGTAILGLHRMDEAESEMERQDIDRLALELAADDGVAPDIRMTAIQVCANRHLESVIPIAEAALQNSTSTGLRMSSIAALGMLGTERHIAMLTALQTSDSALKPAISEALRRLQIRIAKSY